MLSAHPLPTRLKQAREAKGFTQTELGLRIGLDISVASSRMNHYEKGRHLPDYTMLQKMADELGVPVAYFYCDSDEMADLLMSFHNLTPEQKKQVIDFVNKQKISG
ncbi:helix-turn-helix domain-containing protein [Rheinheimera salexigens]|uniref:Transcriptional regulator n=1 Tax=Rheinheimera salexigens TaxID=1628148 RepID=A0A1E7Q3W6_9GAMM|nr:helix-turn-helix transcriptional regulator [Rheinheimera salexigens]OEY68816.1 transcriptional regulator [Rheinheimera salexigens]